MVHRCSYGIFDFTLDAAPKTRELRTFTAINKTSYSWRNLSPIKAMHSPKLPSIPPLIAV